MLSAIVICLCGQPHPAYVTTARASELRYSSAMDTGLPEEAIAAAGLGGLDGATLPADPEADPMAAENLGGAMLTRNDMRGGEAETRVKTGGVKD
ncbi:MAG TPA: hypothetical protein VGN52_00550 [Burkholderiales bacterium]